MGLDHLQREWSSLVFPDEFEGAGEYARKMHQYPFSLYLNRLRQIGFQGKRVLDAGCGTGTWSFAMAVDSEEVHGVDRNSPRIEVADWIRKRYDVGNVRFRDQDITRLDFKDGVFDAVFCYGVIISYLSLPGVLTELRRVTRVGGLLYVCLNGLGWCQYLRDERGRDSETHAEMGRTGIYNTVCQRELGDLKDKLKAIPSEPSEEAQALVELLDRWRTSREADASAPDVDECRFLLARVGGLVAPEQANPLLAAADVIQHECGPAYLAQLADDVVGIALGGAADFSHSRAGRCYEPDDVSEACRAAGFGELIWGDEGSLAAPGSNVKGESLYGGWFGGHRQVWEFTARAGAAAISAPAVPTSEKALAEAGWLLKEDRWARRMVPGRCELRPYPFPYRAAISISNDTDCMTWESLDALHDFVNGTGATKYGDGLGLEMSDSIWVWSPEGFLSLFHNMPYERDARPAPETGRLIELAEAGFIDTLHGFGEWREEWHVDRDAVSWALDRLSSLGIAANVYVNHGGRGGGGIAMKHNIGGPWSYYQDGDDPGARSYCLDLLRGSGYRYFWTDVLFDLHKFGDYRRFRNQLALDRAVGQYDFRRFLTRRDPDSGAPVYEAFPGASEEEMKELRKTFFNHGLFTFPARDGSVVYGFKRFRGTSAPNSGNFPLQVSSERLDDLEKHEGAVIVYQHFGVWRAVGMDKGHDSRRETGADVLDAHAVEAFREIARRRDAGRLWVTGTGRMLDYLRVRDNLVFQVREEGDAHVIRVKRVQCPVEGALPMRREMLAGLAFSVPRSWGKVVVEVDRIADVPRYRREPDGLYDDRDAVYFEWPALEYPESRSGRGFLRRALGLKR